MSDLEIKKITDRAGTGSPNFTNGVKVSGTDSGLLAPTRTEGETQPDAETASNGDTFYDTVNDTYDILTEGAWTRVIGEGGGVASWTVDISSFTDAGVSDFIVGAQEGNPSGMVWKTDGTSFYVSGRGNDSIHQYDCTTAFDLTTASFANKEVSVISQASEAWGVTANADGTSFYVACGSTHSVYQYDLTTAWDISTASYASKSFDAQTQSFFGRGVRFNTDGTKMFYVGASNDYIYEYNLSTAFDVSTAAYSSKSLSVGSQDEQVYHFSFNPDGTQLIAVGSLSDSLYQYSLTTGFDLSTATYDSVSFSVASHDSNPRAVTFNTDGTKAYVVGDSGNNIKTYSTGL